MRFRRLVLFTGIAAAATAGHGLASAQEPTFEDFAAPVEEPAAPEVEWKASAQAGLILTTGNSRVTTLAGGAKASRKADRNKFEGEVGGAFARSSLSLASDVNGNGAIDDGEIERIDQTTARSWLTRARYDRFLTDNNSVYVAALASGDKPAGKSFVGGGQAGYSRTLVENDTHNIVVEGGYDYSYEDYIEGDGLSIHSVRGYAGYTGELSEDTALGASSELLSNFNELDTPTGPASRFEDSRLSNVISLTTQLHDSVNLRFGFTAKYDNVPAPAPPFPGIEFAEGFVPEADKLDTITDASIIVNFL